LIERQRLVIPHQAIIEFVAAVIRPVNGLDGRSLLSRPDALTEAESLMSQFELVYPNDLVLRTALRGVLAYRMAWFDAHLWAYAETMGIRELLSEDFSRGQVYGQVRIRNPFVEADEVMQLPPLYSDDGPGR
jgi:predicted nucleic acid-binding protein